MAGNRGGRGGRGGRGPLPRDVQVSKKMSRVLRHSAEQEGLKLGPGGYVNVKDLLQTNSLRSLKVSFDEIRAIVSSNDKQRFSLIPVSEAPEGGSTADSTTSTAIDESDPSHHLIRANQGHSIASVANDSLLTPVTPADLPPLCVHGTTAAAWPLILSAGGLKPMARNHIHFAAGLPAGFQPLEPSSSPSATADSGAAAEAEAEAEKEQPPVISGMRNTSRVLIYVDVAKALEAGIPFHRSANGVVLSEGDRDKGGLLGVEFFARVEDRKGRAVLVRDGQVLGDGGVEAMRKDAGGSGRRR